MYGAFTSCSSPSHPTPQQSKTTYIGRFSSVTGALTHIIRICRKKVITTESSRATSTNVSRLCNFDSYPYQVRTYARQLIIRESNITERSLITSCELSNSVRSDNNPQGFIMERFEILTNRDLRTIKR